MSASRETPESLRPPSGWRDHLLDWRVWPAALWLVAFFAFFYSFTLPNSGVERVELWKQLPFLLLENVDPSEEALGESASNWGNLSQRADLLLVAATILAGAWGLGHLILRAIGLIRGDSRIGSSAPEDGQEEDTTVLSWSERTVFAFGLGISGLTLLTLGCGMAGWLSRPLLGGLIVAFLAGELVWRALTYRPADGAKTGRVPLRYRRGEVILTYGQMLYAACLLIMVPFVLAMVLGAMLPPVDFDVKAYHLVGPKEWFQAGAIRFLPHNVYTSFPFLTEMVSLLAMVLRDDWYRGALAGQAALAAFGPLTALAVFAAGSRWFGPVAGMLAATIHLTVPWTYRISVIAYAEGGLTFYLFATLLATMLVIRRLALPPTQKDGPGEVIAAEDLHESAAHRTFPRDLPRPPLLNGGRIALLAGMLAGSAMACKYPGVLQVVFPLGVALCVAPFVLRSSPSNRWGVAGRIAVLFGAGVGLTIGPWLVKNLVETGNPVYPLAYGIFGGRDLSPELAAKWRAGHSPPDHDPLKLINAYFVDVVARSDWLSPLLFGLAPLALFARGRQRMVRWLWVYVGFLFFGWWLFTHRIDRFWIPLIPVVALLAGVGAVWRANRLWYAACGAAVAAATLFNLAFITTSLVGNNAYLVDLDEARAASASTATGIAFLNEHLPPGSKVLAVGEAQVFDAQFPVVYNSVFDEAIFELWFAEPETGVAHGELALRDAEEIRGKLEAEGITHVYVNWQEILRYRGPGSYGYTDFAAPQRFARLREMGVLGAPLTHAGVRWDSLTASDRKLVESWAPELKTKVNGEPALLTIQLYPVLR